MSGTKWEDLFPFECFMQHRADDRLIDFEEVGNAVVMTLDEIECIACGQPDTIVKCLKERCFSAILGRYSALGCPPRKVVYIPPEEACADNIIGEITMCIERLLMELWLSHNWISELNRCFLNSEIQNLEAGGVQIEVSYINWLRWEGARRHPSVVFSHN